jgi:hypothetical protein
MRMWMIDPKLMCRKHLLGEHVEMHMFVGTLQKGVSVEGYVNGGLFDSRDLKTRHDELVEEMTRRGYNHKSPLPTTFDAEAYPGIIDIDYNLKDLATRCIECKELQTLYTSEVMNNEN